MSKYQLNPIFEFDSSNDNTNGDNLNTAPLYAMGSGVAGVAGGELLRKNFDRLNGTVTRFHNTDTKNVNDIMKNGILAKFADDPNNITNRILTDVDAAKKKGLVYTSKGRLLAKQVGLQRKNIGLSNNGGKTLKLKFNYDDIKKMARIDNPELRGLSKEEFIKDRMKWLDNHPFRDPLARQPKSLQRLALSDLYDQFKNGTHVFAGNIDASHIVGSDKYKSQIDWKRWKQYVKNNPKRFAKGAGLSLAGLTALAGSGYLAKKAYDNHKQNQNKED